MRPHLNYSILFTQTVHPIAFTSKTHVPNLIRRGPLASLRRRSFTRPASPRPLRPLRPPSAARLLIPSLPLRCAALTSFRLFSRASPPSSDSAWSTKPSGSNCRRARALPASSRSRGRGSTNVLAAPPYQRNTAPPGRVPGVQNPGHNCCGAFTMAE